MCSQNRQPSNSDETNTNRPLRGAVKKGSKTRNKTTNTAKLLQLRSLIDFQTLTAASNPTPTTPGTTRIDTPQTRAGPFCCCLSVFAHSGSFLELEDNSGYQEASNNISDAATVLVSSSTNPGTDNDFDTSLHSVTSQTSDTTTSTIPTASSAALLVVSSMPTSATITALETTAITLGQAQPLMNIVPDVPVVMPLPVVPSFPSAPQAEDVGRTWLNSDDWI